MSWLDTTGQDEANDRVSAFWDQLSAALSDGTFWATRIAHVRSEPRERLKIAVENLPLPAAFREAAIAIRSLVRQRIKEKLDFKEELSLLYWLAAIESFGVPYSEFLGQPGCNVLETVPGNVIRSLRFTYDTLGYQKLRLLGKTDIKWCVSCWGEPRTHTTLHDLYADLWHKYELETRERQQAELRKLLSQFD